MAKNVIVIPTYNERENVSLLVEEIFSLLPKIHILVVDDNSPDGTAVAIKKLQAQYSKSFSFKKAG